MKTLNTLTACLLMLLVTQISNAADRFWIAGTSSNFNTTANWSATSGGSGGASVPGASDIAIYNGGGLGNCTLDINIDVGGLNVEPGYTSTISQGTFTMNIGSSGMNFEGGVFDGGSADITINGNLTIDSTGGVVFTSTSGTLDLRGNYTKSASSTFNHNNGTLKFLKASNTIVGSTTLNNLEFSTDVFSSSFIYEIGSSTVLTVTGDLLLTGFRRIRLNTGTIDAQGDITITNIGDSTAGGTATIHINGTGNQTLTGSGANKGKLPNINIDKPSGTLILSGIISLGRFSNLTFTQGTIDASTNNSTVFFFKKSTITGSLTLHNVEFFHSPQGANLFEIAIGTELTVTGLLKLSGGVSALNLKGILNVQGDVLVANRGGLAGGTAKYIFNGTGNQLWTGGGQVGRGWLQNVDIDKPSGTLTLASIISVGVWNYIRGDVDAITNTSTVVINSVDGEGLTETMVFHNLITRSGNIGIGGDLIINGVLTNLILSRLRLNSHTLTLLNPSPNAFVSAFKAGVVSETTDNEGKVQWNIGNNTGTYVFNFITTIATAKIPLAINITTAGTQSGTGNITVSTYKTNANNLPFPGGPEAVTNIEDEDGVSRPLDAMDRFWQIEANNYSVNPTADISFTYLDDEASFPNTINEFNLAPIQWNSSVSEWQQVEVGIGNPLTNVVTALSVNTFSHWTLADFIANPVPGKNLCTGVIGTPTTGASPCAAATIAFCNSTCPLGCSTGPCQSSPSFCCICPNCQKMIYEVFYINFGTANVNNCELTVILPPGVNVLSPITPCAPFSTSGNIASGFTLVWNDLCDAVPPSGCPSVKTPGSFGVITIPTEVACCLPIPTPVGASAEITFGPDFCLDPPGFDQYTCSFDPNSKVLASHNPCEVIEKTDTLVYRINFQNIGLATATNVVVIDTLDFVNLDVSSVVSLETSDTATFTITPPGILTWTFDSINLPDSASDPAGSNGFILFSVIPDQNITPGTIVEDKAAIFFDFNPPIITNTTSVTIEGELLSVDAGSDQTIFLGFGPQSVNLTATATGGAGTTTFLWSTGETTQTITVSPTNTTVFSVIVTDTNSCTAEDAVVVEVIDIRCGNNLNKVFVCHIPPGDPNNAHTICISPNAVQAHLNHGDFLGECVFKTGASGTTTNGSYDKMQISELVLEAYPNPFNKTTTFNFILPRSEYITLEVFSINGQETIKVFSGNVEANIGHTVDFDASNLSSGVYYYRLITATSITTKKLVIY